MWYSWWYPSYSWYLMTMSLWYPDSDVSQVMGCPEIIQVILKAMVTTGDSSTAPRPWFRPVADVAPWWSVAGSCSAPQKKIEKNTLWFPRYYPYNVCICIYIYNNIIYIYIYYNVCICIYANNIYIYTFDYIIYLIKTIYILYTYLIYIATPQKMVEQLNTWKLWRRTYRLYTIMEIMFEYLFGVAII